MEKKFFQIPAVYSSESIKYGEEILLFVRSSVLFEVQSWKVRSFSKFSRSKLGRSKLGLSRLGRS